MNIEPLYPYAGNHAVQNAIFAVEWAEPLKSDVIQSLGKLATKFRNLGLSNVEYRKTIEIKIDRPAPGAAVPSQKQSEVLDAVIFTKPALLGEIPRSVTISRQGCMIAVPDYTRWAEVFNDVNTYFKIALDEIPPRPITVVGLQYNDLFIWKDDPAELDLRDIFSASTFIPPSVFSQTGLWHLHHGYILKESAPTPHSRLDNINVDMIEHFGERAIQITSSHKVTFNDPLWQPHQKNKQIMFDMFSYLHMINKEVLEKLLTIDVSRKIQLTT